MKPLSVLVATFVGALLVGLGGAPQSALAIKGLKLSAPTAVPSTTTAAPEIIYEDWFDPKTGRQIPVKIYMPKTGPGPFPLVIFSHGLGGNREAATYLGDGWARHGYIGLFIQHPGSDTKMLKPVVGGTREDIIRKFKEAANGQNLLDRVTDGRFVIDELNRRISSDPHLRGKIQLNKIAMAGHSFGAGTTLALAGQYFPIGNFTDNRIKAAIYLCPPVIGAGSFVPEQKYGNIKLPGMLLTGTKDDSTIGGTKAEDRRVPFDGIRASHQYLINFDGADHGVFGGRSFRQPAPSDLKTQAMVIELTTKFLDATLNHDRAAEKWLDDGGAEAYLGKSAVFEHK